MKIHWEFLPLCASHLTDLFRLWMDCKVERLIDAYVPCEPCLYASDTCMCKHSDVWDWWFHTKRFAETEINLSRATFITHSSCLWWGGSSFCSNLNKIRLMLTRNPTWWNFSLPLLIAKILTRQKHENDNHKRSEIN